MNYLRIAPLAAALLWAAPAEAAILEYTYQGQPLSCVSPCSLPSWGGFSGKFVFDEAMLPGGTLAGLSFDFDWLFGTDGFTFAMNTTLVISNQSGVLATYHRQEPDLFRFDWSDYGIVEGLYGNVFAPSVQAAGMGGGNFHLNFNAHKAITGWGGCNTTGGYDPCGGGGSGEGYDIQHYPFFMRSLGEGVWSPHPVPLPPALLMFLSALGLGGLLGWRRRRA